MFFRDSHHHGEWVLTAFGRRDKGLGMSRWLSPLRVLKYSHARLEFNLPFDLNVNLIALERDRPYPNRKRIPLGRDM